jgi:hypothetical protein
MVFNARPNSDNMPDLNSQLALAELPDKPIRGNASGVAPIHLLVTQANLHQARFLARLAILHKNTEQHDA